MKSRPAADLLWMPFTAHQDNIDFPPAVISKGEGIYLYGTDGKQYIDATGSWWVSSLGHCNPQINAAVKRQLDRLEHVMMAGFISEPTLELTEILGSLLPEPLSKIFYSDDGSTAVEVAMKIAIQYHSIRGSERCAFVSLGDGYHGDTLGAMSVGAIPSFHGLFHKRFKEQYFADSPYCFRCPVKQESQSTCDAQCMDSLERILKEHGARIAACVFEPMVQGAAGMRVYPAKVLNRIVDLCKRYDVLTIADEVATGLGRTGEMFACGHAKIVPDMMCLAKGLTGGYLPIAVTAVSGEIYEEFKGGYRSNRILNHGHTFTGNPLASSAAVAALNQLIEKKLPHSAESTIKYFSEQLSSLNNDEHISGIRHLGFIGAFELVKDRGTKEKFPPELRLSFKLAQKALSKGLIIRPLGDTVYYMPPFNVTTQEIDTILSLTKEALRETLGEVMR
ncbi:MAG: adenosylmethionine--8-amino-7-oxononanoate transaminase [Chitinispirillia bacterium]|nr:adenosylmethionine--8-amino-7-oxononanoate transaminase [Chitinispirillia bacterium]MCL2267747.1 adenosylmethionine--8-amino-7-oxononanoate transaminase [Chitinispirillia bacterium]